MKKLLLAFTFIVFSSSFLTLKGQSWLWARQVLGNAYTEGYNPVCDNKGNVYMLGMWAPVSGQYMVIGADTFDYNYYNTKGGNEFIIKYDSGGNFMWVRQCYGGAAPNEIAIDKSNNIYETGYFSDTTYFGSCKIYSSFYNAYIVKYDENGNALWAYSPVESKGAFDMGIALATDKQNNVYLTGNFKDSIQFGTIVLKSLGGSNSFVVKFDSNGKVLWAKAFGGNSPYGDGVGGIAVDGNNCPVITGAFSSPIVIFGASKILNYGVTADVFTAKYDPNGNPLWAVADSGTRYDCGCAIVIDKNNYIYISGNFTSPVAAFGKDVIPRAQGPYFVVKYDMNGNEKWAKGGETSYLGYNGGMQTDSCDDIYLVDGCGPAFTINGVTYNAPWNGSDPTFIVELDSAGNTLAGMVTGTGGDDWNGIAQTNSDEIYFGADLEMNVFWGDSLYQTASENLFISKLKFGMPSCSIAPSQPVVTEPCASLFIPDAFSPNGDGQNDVLYVRGACIKTMDFVIYDRWGNKVFESQNQSIGWDGKYGGQPMNTGTYVYYLTGITTNGNTVDKKGTVELVR